MELNKMDFCSAVNLLTYSGEDSYTRFAKTTQPLKLVSSSVADDDL